MKGTTITIDAIAAGGAGVGRLADGRAVFVQRTAPGDTVTIEVMKLKQRWATGRLLKIVTAGTGRRDAPCPHYARCGGCTLEHMTYAEQLAAKAGIVRETLRRIGKIAIETPEVVASPTEFRYRNRVSFTLVRTATGQVTAGFHELDRPDRIIDISADCLMPEPSIASAWQQLRANWGEGASLLPSGETLRLTLRANRAGDVGLVIDGGYGPGQASRLLDAVPSIRSVWHRSQGAASHVLLAGESPFAEVWREEPVQLSGAMFLQVNRVVAEHLEDHVFERAIVGLPNRVIDAYCGVGLHARRLARGGVEVVGLELDSAAITEAQRAAHEGTRFVPGMVEDTLAAELPADLVILNPPRAGVDARVTEALVATPPARIVYVSCDPATLARDLARLTPRFQLAGVRCFDLFPQTTHVETVAELVCATS